MMALLACALLILGHLSLVLRVNVEDRASKRFCAWLFWGGGALEVLAFIVAGAALVVNALR